MALGGSGGGGGSGNIRAGGAFVELFTKSSLKKGLGAAAAEVEAFGKRVAGLGAITFAGGATGLAAIGGVFAAATSRAAEFDAVAARLGDTTENLSAFAYAASTAKVPLEQLLDNWENWPDRLTKAASGTDELSEKFRALGINAAEMKTKPIVQQMLDLAAAMGKVTNNTDRLALLGELFSDKGQGFNELFKKGPDAIRALMAEAKDVGAVVTTDQGKQAREVERAWNKSYASVRNAILSVGDALLPSAGAIATVGEQVVAAAKAAREWMGENKEVVVGLGLVSVGAVGVGAAMVALAPVAKFVAASITLGAAISSAAWSGLTTVVTVGNTIMSGGIAGIAAAVLAIPAAVAVAGGAWLAFTQQGRVTARGWAAAVGTAISETFGETWDNLVSGWKAVVKNVQRGDLTSAVKIGVATLKLEWLNFTQYLERLWLKLNQRLQNTWAGTEAAIGLLMKAGRAAGIIKDPPPVDQPAAGGPAAPAQPNAVEKFFGIQVGLAANAFNDVADNLGLKELAQNVMPKAQAAAVDAAKEIANVAQQVGKAGKEAEDKLDDEQKKEKLQAQVEVWAAKNVPDMKNFIGNAGDWLSGGLKQAAKLLTPDNLPTDLTAKAGEVRASIGGDATRNFFGVGQGNSPIDRMNSNLGGKLNKLVDVATELQRANDLLALIESKTGPLLVTS